MKYLVTGGAGFIGSHLVESLIRNGYTVRILDDFSGGSRANLDSIRAHPLLEIVEGDVRNAELVGRLATGMDGIFHQAALVSVQQSLEQPALSFDINVRGTVAVLEAARLTGIKRVVLASSSAVYGDSPVLPLREDIRTDPLSPYALDKQTMEHYALLYQRLYGLETIALRYFNVYGPRQSPASPYSSVISLFSDQISRGKGVTVYGDGEQSRDFIHVFDVVQANIVAMTGKYPGFRTYNVGSGCETTINRLIEIFTMTMGHPVPVSYAPSRIGDIRRSCADIRQACTELGFHPQQNIQCDLSTLVQTACVEKVSQRV